MEIEDTGMSISEQRYRHREMRYGGDSIHTTDYRVEKRDRIFSSSGVEEDSSQEVTRYPNKSREDEECP